MSRCFHCPLPSLTHIHFLSRCFFLTLNHSLSLIPPPDKSKTNIFPLFPIVGPTLWLSRLLDICYGKRLEIERQLSLYLVFEYVEQDLGAYLYKCPEPGLGPDRIKVKFHSSPTVHTRDYVLTIKLS